MAGFQWNTINPNFSGSNQLRAQAASGIAQAGQTFSNVASASTKLAEQARLRQVQDQEYREKEAAIAANNIFNEAVVASDGASDLDIFKNTIDAGINQFTPEDADRVRGAMDNAHLLTAYANNSADQYRKASAAADLIKAQAKLQEEQNAAGGGNLMADYTKMFGAQQSVTYGEQEDGTFGITGLNPDLQALYQRYPHLTSTTLNAYGNAERLMDARDPDGALKSLDEASYTIAAALAPEDAKEHQIKALSDSVKNGMFGSFYQQVNKASKDRNNAIKLIDNVVGEVSAQQYNTGGETRSMGSHTKSQLKNLTTAIGGAFPELMDKSGVTLRNMMENYVALAAKKGEMMQVGTSSFEMFSDNWKDWSAGEERQSKLDLFTTILDDFSSLRKLKGASARDKGKTIISQLNELTADAYGKEINTGFANLISQIKAAAYSVSGTEEPADTEPSGAVDNHSQLLSNAAGTTGLNGF